MRVSALVFVTVVAIVAACGGTDRDADSSKDSPQCTSNDECALAGASCCSCPSYAIGVDDPGVAACDGVSCPSEACPGNVQASCVLGSCQMTCLPQTCEMSCTNGFAMGSDGCLLCECAADEGCGSANPCLDVRADCCGCREGGSDTAIDQRGAPIFDADLSCPSAPLCPGDNTCDENAQLRCIAGRCYLLSSSEQVFPPQTYICGRPDLRAVDNSGSDGSDMFDGCPANEICTINVLTAANAEGVGVCVPL